MRDADDEAGPRMVAFDYERVTHVRMHGSSPLTLIFA
jgi:hypothetical protein